MSNFVRKSQFRHVFGQPYKRDKVYESIPISRASTENNMCAVNPKFVAIITESGGGGSFLVLKLDQYGRLDINQPRVCGHKQVVLDIAWCPHNDNIIASCSEDTTVKVWFIPDEGLSAPLTEAEQTLNGHQKKVLSIEWNPVAENILLSYAADDLLIVWDVGAAEALLSVDCHPGVIWSASWNPAGNMIGTTCKDKQLRIIDARSGEVKSVGAGFGSGKCQKIKMLKNDRAIAVGATKMGERQYRFYDINNMETPLTSEGVDNGSNTFNIFYDEDLNMVYLGAKGDCKLLYYEIEDKKPYVFWLSLYTPKDATKGLGFMPKRGLDVNAHEVARFYRLVDRGLCEPTSMIVPRKSELFQNDIYPPCMSIEPSMTTDEWLKGANKPRKDMDMETLFKGTSVAAPAKRSSRLGRSTAASTAPANSQPKAEPNAAPVTAKAPVSRAASNPPKEEVRGGQETKEQKNQLERLLAEVNELKATVKTQEERIATLEAAQD
ncbi:coronin-6-like [Apostichopus japonicus]